MTQERTVNGAQPTPVEEAVNEVDHHVGEGQEEERGKEQVRVAVVVPVVVHLADNTRGGRSNGKDAEDEATGETSQLTRPEKLRKD